MGQEEIIIMKYADGDACPDCGRPMTFYPGIMTSYHEPGEPDAIECDDIGEASWEDAIMLACSYLSGLNNSMANRLLAMELKALPPKVLVVKKD